MVKINFNNSSLQNSLILNLTDSIDMLNSVINKEYQLYIPRKFSYYNKLKQMQTDNINTRNSLTNVKRIVNSINTKYNGEINNIQNSLRLIDNIEIEKRESSIK